MTELAEVPNKRKVMWLYDPVGNQGKSTFIKYIIHTLGQDKAWLATCTAKERIVAAIKNKPNARVVMFDLPREYDMTKFSYACLEMIKDGVGFNTMYHAGTVNWFQPHVIIFSNALPDKTKLTNDRWDIRQISELPAWE
jgi:diaminopimelate epimerase